MGSILEYITLNYTWFLVGLIIILLAIIGYYADKTNFGQGKTEDNEQKNKNLENIRLQEIQEKKIQPEPEEKKLEKEVKVEPVQTINAKTEFNEAAIESKPVTTKKKKVDLDESFKRLDKEFDELLPKKEIIDDELLDEINSLSLDKTQKLNLTDIPDLDDLDLPKIKSLKSIDEDIWKF